MPDLPEVEHIAQGLNALLPGHTISDILIRWERILATHSPIALQQTLRGLTFESVSRRGKFLLFAVPPYHLLVHLRMTGALIFRPAADEALAKDSHTHLIVCLDKGAYLYYRDPRKFGRWYLVSNPHEALAHLGPEPLSDDLTPERLGQRLHRRRQIKPLLLDQRVIAGLGNIYTDEILWDAGLHPLTPGDALAPEQIERLHASMQKILRQAIANGGTSLQDYRGACGERGQHQYSLAVYGRQGEPCPRCGAPIERIIVAQRGTYHCPRCQPAYHPPSSMPTGDAL